MAGQRASEIRESDYNLIDRSMALNQGAQYYQPHGPPPGMHDLRRGNKGVAEGQHGGGRGPRTVQSTVHTELHRIAFPTRPLPVIS